MDEADSYIEREMLRSWHEAIFFLSSSELLYHAIQKLYTSRVQLCSLSANTSDEAEMFEYYSLKGIVRELFGKQTAFSTCSESTGVIAIRVPFRS